MTNKKNTGPCEDAFDDLDDKIAEETEANYEAEEKNE